ncbi:MOSC domain-containing protein [Jeotgalibacillus salarius]|uniref:MOSC domain-containing protein n=1 Tax=Jeotgalibacillus salarius TaxID=546023 RepID=A0A4Y8LHI3_9BACL|nr:MOSC domain-containing protein [Jeotgalibacillus salarius]TFE02280.1 MOSC domain-containing protein [Jeotgalibacillus salarius]
MEQIGKISAIIRHPVKSLSGEQVESTKLMAYGVYGDRSHTFLEENRYHTATQNPKMVGYSAAFDGEESAQQFPRVLITAPDGRTFYWDDEACLDEFQELAGKPLKKEVYAPENVPLGAIEEEHILIVNEASVKALEEETGKPIDWRRFRPNLVVSLINGTPFSEEQLAGKRLQIGSTEIEIVRPCERCSIINIDPVSTGIDPLVLKTVYQKHGNIFGMYAAVRKAGVISVNDKILAAGERQS